jgi:hypothetical protein
MPSSLWLSLPLSAAVHTRPHQHVPPTIEDVFLQDTVVVYLHVVEGQGSTLMLHRLDKQNHQILSNGSALLGSQLAMLKRL